MTTFALIHGSGDDGWAWHLVQRALRVRGHEGVAPDLPTDRDDATWNDCVDVVVEGVGGAGDVVMVGQSSGGFLVPLVADRLGARLQVFIAGMVPRPGERASEWFDNAGWSKAVAERAQEDGGLTGNPNPMLCFYHDVPAELATQAMARERPTCERLAQTAWPLPAMPSIAARYIVTTQDRFIPPPVQRRIAVERLGIAEPDEIDSGHCASLNRRTKWPVSSPATSTDRTQNAECLTRRAGCSCSLMPICERCPADATAAFRWPVRDLSTPRGRPDHDRVLRRRVTTVRPAVSPARCHIRGPAGVSMV